MLWSIADVNVLWTLLFISSGSALFQYIVQWIPDEVNSKVHETLILAMNKHVDNPQSFWYLWKKKYSWKLQKYYKTHFTLLKELYVRQKVITLINFLKKMIKNLLTLLGDMISTLIIDKRSDVSYSARLVVYFTRTAKLRETKVWST